MSDLHIQQILRWVKAVAFLPFCLLTFLLFSCSPAASKEDLASMAAKGYYEHLIRGEYDQFLEGLDKMAYLDSLEMIEKPGLSYHSQLIDNLRQFMAQQEQAHGGISEVHVSNVRKDTLTDYTSVFLVLCFKDSTKEEIIVPMVERADGRWRMRQ